MEAGWRETPASRRSERSGGDREEAGKAETERAERHSETETKAAICTTLMEHTDLMFTAEIGAACFLKVDTGVGEAETRVYEEIHMNGGHI